MEKNLEIVETGLQCDNQNCDWKDTTITFETYGDWLNKPCPKCGENVLTEEDFKNAEVLRISYQLINSLSQDDLNKLSNLVGNKHSDELRQSPLFKDTIGLENLDASSEKRVTMSVSTHKEIKVDSIQIDGGI